MGPSGPAGTGPRSLRFGAAPAYREFTIIPCVPPGIRARRRQLLQRNNTVPDRVFDQGRQVIDAELAHQPATIRLHGAGRQADRGGALRRASSRELASRWLM